MTGSAVAFAGLGLIWGFLIGWSCAVHITRRQERRRAVGLFRGFQARVAEMRRPLFDRPLREVIDARRAAVGLPPRDWRQG